MKTALIILLGIACQSLGADSATSTFIEREYRVPERFLAWAATYDDKTPQRDTSKDWLLRDMPYIPPGTRPQVLYLHSQKLIVRHTAAFHDACRKLVAQWNKSGRYGQPPDKKILEELRAADAPYKQ